jgi:hypothetical protein
MKKNILKTISALILTAALLPLVSSAQDKEFYLRPSYWRPYDQRGINVFETTKAPDTIAFEGPRIRFGAGFTQQFQNLKQSNKDATDNANTRRLVPVTPGFMTAQANLFTDIQLADGIRLNLTTYLSTRHHNEAWVKGGYIQFDKLPFKGKFWTDFMEMATIKVGHMEINYGDQHFRRSDAGQALYNPFMESYIVDAFTTEIGGEIYLQKKGFFGMVAVSNGMIKGNTDSTYVVKNGTGQIIDDNTKRAPSIYLKGGIDKQITTDLRVRGAVSYYHNSSSAASGLTLYSGDRAGSNYQNVMELAGFAVGAPGKSLPATTAMATSGRMIPGYSKNVDAIMLNGFVKAGGLEFFGTYETANGRTKNETSRRDMNQVAGELIYRFGKAENLYVGGRYNTVTMRLAGMTADVTVDRVAGAAGWFLTKNVLLKAEIVKQQYKKFPTTDYRAGGQFSGYVIEAVVGF